MRKKYYLTLDTETATLPFAYQNCTSAKQKQKVAIAKPLVYDIGWVISDRQGSIIKRENFLVQETFFVPNVFNTAYYRDKRPVYMGLLSKGEICAKPWNDIIDVLLEDLRVVDISTAYNAAFDFKKAIPFTESYINALYSVDYNEWERKQKYSCENIARGYTKDDTNPDFLNPVFELRGECFPIADLWNVACCKLINIDKYRDYCLESSLLTASAQYFKSNAETTFQYLANKHDFIEEHTALSDVLIEAEILTKALKKGAVPPQMEAFPFRNLGTSFDYVREKRPRYADIVIDCLAEYLANYEGNTRYKARMEKILVELEEFAESWKKEQKAKKKKVRR